MSNAHQKVKIRAFFELEPGHPTTLERVLEDTTLQGKAIALLEREIASAHECALSTENELAGLYRLLASDPINS